MSDTANQTSLPERTDPRPVWLVEHPLHRYREDVKSLARTHALQIVDVAVASEDDRAHATSEPPQLTQQADEEPGVEAESRQAEEEPGAEAAVKGAGRRGQRQQSAGQE